MRLKNFFSISIAIKTLDFAQLSGEHLIKTKIFSVVWKDLNTGTWYRPFPNFNLMTSIENSDHYFYKIFVPRE